MTGIPILARPRLHWDGPLKFNDYNIELFIRLMLRRINTMPTDALGLKITRASAGMILAV